MRNVGLLGLEMDLLWGPDLYGRPPSPHPLVALALADDAWEMRLRPRAPDDLRELLAEDPTPEGIERCRERLGGTAALGGGPSYAFAERPSCPIPPGLRIVTSEEGGAVGRPESWDDPEEWRDLLAGRLGPWAVGLDGDRAVSVTHTPVASPLAAEAGAWTHPDARGRGCAPAVTAAWAEVASRRFGTLFYSTDFGNAASQAVARRLGLRPIGAIWQIQGEPDRR